MRSRFIRRVLMAAALAVLCASSAFAASGDGWSVGSNGELTLSKWEGLANFIAAGKGGEKVEISGLDSDYRALINVDYKGDMMDNAGLPDDDPGWELKDDTLIIKSNKGANLDIEGSWFYGPSTLTSEQFGAIRHIVIEGGAEYFSASVVGDKLAGVRTLTVKDGPKPFWFGHQALSRAKLESIVCEREIAIIKNHAFYNSELKSVTFAKGVGYISQRAFDSSKGIDITINGDVKAIDSSAVDEGAGSLTINGNAGILVFKGTGRDKAAKIRVTGDVAYIGPYAIADIGPGSLVEIGGNVGIISNKAFQSSDSVTLKVGGSSVPLFMNDTGIQSSNVASLAVSAGEDEWASVFKLDKSALSKPAPKEAPKEKPKEKPETQASSGATQANNEPSKSQPAKAEEAKSGGIGIGAIIGAVVVLIVIWRVVVTMKNKDKPCAVCGEKLGVSLGYTKLSDGMLCKKCSAKLSPLYNVPSSASSADIQRHLAYREQNKQELASFAPITSYGYDLKVFVDPAARKFCVTRGTDWRSGEPDVISFDQVASAACSVKENKTELKTKDADGRSVSYNPPRYEVKYDFHLDISVRSEWFNQIHVDLTDDNHLPASPVEPLYRQYDAMARECADVLMGRAQPGQIIAQANMNMTGFGGYSMFGR